MDKLAVSVSHLGTGWDSKSTCGVPIGFQPVPILYQFDKDVSIVLTMIRRAVRYDGMEVGDALKEFRRRKRLTAAEFGAMVGVWFVTVYRWERGEQRIHEKHLPKVSEVTGIPKAILRPDLAALLAE